MTIRFKT